MISKVEVKNYRCLRYINVPLKNFHVLVGPNASVKTTFLDVIAFLGDIVEGGPDQAVKKRASNFLDLVWMHQNEILEFAIEVNVPEEIVSKISHNFDTLRYEISIGYQDQELGIFDERVIFKKFTDELKNYNGNQVNAFPVTREHPGSILSQLRSKSTRTVINKKYKANDNFYSEVTSQAGKGWGCLRSS